MSERETLIARLDAQLRMARDLDLTVVKVPVQLLRDAAQALSGAVSPPSEGWTITLMREEIEQCIEGLTQREMWGTAEALASRFEKLLAPPASDGREEPNEQ